MAKKSAGLLMFRQGASGLPAALLFLALAASSCASTGRSAPPAGPVVRRGFFALSVSDVDRLAAWYRDNLGFEVQLKNPSRDGGPAGAILSRDGALLELLSFPTAKPRAAWGLPKEAEQVQGILKVGFEVADVEAWFATAHARHLTIFFPLVKPPGSRLRTFGVLDPDGNIVQFFGR